MSEKKRTVRKREFVIQRRPIEGEIQAKDGDELPMAWFDISSGHNDTATAMRHIRDKQWTGKFRIIAVCEEVEAKEVTEKKIVFG